MRTHGIGGRHGLVVATLTSLYFVWSPYYACTHVVVDESRKSWYYYTHEDIVFVCSIFTCLQLVKIIISAHSYNILPSLVQ